MINASQLKERITILNSTVDSNMLHATLAVWVGLAIQTHIHISTNETEIFELINDPIRFVIILTGAYGPRC